MAAANCTKSRLMRITDGQIVLIVFYSIGQRDRLRVAKLAKSGGLGVGPKMRFAWAFDSMLYKLD